MENNGEKEKLSDFEEDFKDFEEDTDESDLQLDVDIAGVDIDKLQENIKNTYQTQEPQEPEESQEQAPKEENKQEEEEKSPWDEFDNGNSAVKKYIFYVSRDFVPYIDNLSTDERSAYINDAIQKKIDFEDEKKKSEMKRRITAHFVVMILTFVLASPFVLWLSHKAIMATFENYKYSQENFEKLYKQRFEKDRAYMRSIQYNKEQEAKKNK